MSSSPRIDWRTCHLQTAWYAVAYTVYSTTEAIRVTGDGTTLLQAVPLWAVSLAAALAASFVTGLILSISAQMPRATQRRSLWRSVLIVPVASAVQPPLNTFLLQVCGNFLLPSAMMIPAANPFSFWRSLVAGALFLAYCLFVQRSRERQDQLARAALERASAEVRLREARARALEHRVDPQLLERAVAALRTAYASDRVAGEALLDILVDFLRLAMPAVRTGGPVDSGPAILRAWQRLQQQLEDPHCVPVTDK